MIIYSITSIIKEEIEEEWVSWMRDIHIPDILKTGYFKAHKIYKVQIPSTSIGEVTYIIQYELDSLELYREYSSKEAARLQSEVSAKFIGRAKVARTVMEEI